MSLKLPKMYDLVEDTRRQVQTIGNDDNSDVSSHVFLPRVSSSILRLEVASALTVVVNF